MAAAAAGRAEKRSALKTVAAIAIKVVAGAAMC